MEVHQQPMGEKGGKTIYNGKRGGGRGATKSLKVRLVENLDYVRESGLVPEGGKERGADQNEPQTL